VFLPQKALLDKIADWTVLIKENPAATETRYNRISGIYDLSEYPVEMDAEHLHCQNDTFDWAMATFVFCCMPNAIYGSQKAGYAYAWTFATPWPFVSVAPTSTAVQ
jgi:hypothetical protein